MAKIIHEGPVNPAQVLAAVGADTCTVRARDNDGTFEVDVPGVAASAITSALAGIVYDGEIASVAEALGES